MKKKRLFSKEALAYTLIFIFSSIFVLPAILTPGIWKTFDSPFHISMIAQFHTALKYLQIPVVWTDGVANYGLPFGIIAHPLTSYLGGLITFITSDPLTSYKILWLLFSCITSWGMYRLLRKFTSIWPAVAGTILYTFTAYHILNLYIRGALPEFAAAAWLPFLLVALFEEMPNKKWPQSFIVLTFWYTLIFFTHPMYLLFSFFVTTIFLLYYRPGKTFWITVFMSALTALLINAFYVLPLNLEMKYFYMGRETNFLAKGSGLNLNRFFLEQWEYTCSDGDSPAYRCNRVQTGLLEAGILLFSPVLFFLIKDKSRKKLIMFVFFLGVFSTLMLLNLLQPLYEKIKILGSIQFLFRFLNIWILVPPIIAAITLESLPRFKKIIIPVFILAILLIRIPQLYVKNVTNPPRSFYYFNTDNIHSVMMNTVWMGEPKDYKKQPRKGEVISGNGRILSTNITPTKHSYTVQNNSEVLFADYTFYFPGWHAYIDEKEVPIQWQDPNHRGYITFTIPRGNHSVKTVFTDTTIRLAGKIISLLALTGFLLFITLHGKKKYSQ